jgi:hypothetical protein
VQQSLGKQVSPEHCILEGSVAIEFGKLSHDVASKSSAQFFGLVNEQPARLYSPPSTSHIVALAVPDQVADAVVAHSIPVTLNSLLRVRFTSTAFVKSYPSGICTGRRHVPEPEPEPDGGDEEEGEDEEEEKTAIAAATAIKTRKIR